MKIERGKDRYPIDVEIGAILWVALDLGDDRIWLTDMSGPHPVKRKMDERHWSNPYYYELVEDKTALRLYPVPDKDGRIIISYYPPVRML